MTDTKVGLSRNGRLSVARRLSSAECCCHLAPCDPSIMVAVDHVEEVAPHHWLRRRHAHHWGRSHHWGCSHHGWRRHHCWSSHGCHGGWRCHNWRGRHHWGRSHHGGSSHRTHSLLQDVRDAIPVHVWACDSHHGCLWRSIDWWCGQDRRCCHDWWCSNHWWGCHNCWRWCHVLGWSRGNVLDNRSRGNCHCWSRCHILRRSWGDVLNCWRCRNGDCWSRCHILGWSRGNILDSRCCDGRDCWSCCHVLSRSWSDILDSCWRSIGCCHWCSIGSGRVGGGCWGDTHGSVELTASDLSIMVAVEHVEERHDE
mmetsp:Transcript_56379/g.134383  ORF Transcript_56379/g.134383 Transcript_56379/m.134383 type:complete len:311 (-) Transcript_56379:73-1005(-)